MKKKILSIFIIVMICFTIFTINVSAYNNGSYSYHYSSTSDELSGALNFVIICFIIGAFYFIKYLYAKSKDDNAGERMLREMDKQTAQINSFGEPKNFTEQIANEIRKKDENFSGDKFIWFVENYFIAYKDAFSERNIKLIEELTTEDIFFDDKKILEDDIQKGIAHICERINFQTDYIYRYEFNDKFEYASVYIKMKAVEYIKDISTEDSLHGNKNTDNFFIYSITLRRKLGEKTIIDKGITSCQCPNCGSNIDAVIAGKCNFCGQSVKTTKSDWKISAIRKTQFGTDLGISGIFRIT